MNFKKLFFEMGSNFNTTTLFSYSFFHKYKGCIHFHPIINKNKQTKKKKGESFTSNQIINHKFLANLK